MNTDTARADLAYIRSLMEDTRRATGVNGVYFIAWGFAIGLGLVATWLKLEGSLALSIFTSWIICLALGGVATAWLVRRERRDPVQAPGGRLVGTVWLAMGVMTMIIFLVGMGSGSVNGALMPALSSTLVGGAVFLTGVLGGLGWLRNLAFGWWAGAAAMFVWPGVHTLLWMGVLLFALYVVPGVILVRMNRGYAGAHRRD